MTVLDIDDIRAKKAAREAKQDEAVAWGIQAIQEFAAAAVALSTPTRGNPDFMKHVFGADAQAGIWPILREDDPDNLLIQIGHGAAMTGNGKVWVSGKVGSPEDAAWWIAARCHYSIPTMAALFEAALLGSSWNVRTALSQD